MSIRSMIARWAASGLLVASWAAQAQATNPGPTPLPEPEMWMLLGVAAVAGALVSRKRK
ncbi:MAG: hypothetical protein RJA10_1230 [Pseudomonadota bacterium]|jgi:hypothetical protein